MKVPSDREMRETGMALGLLTEGQPVPPHLRAKLANTVNNLKAIEADEVETEQDSGQFDLPAKNFAAGMAAVMSALRDHEGVDDQAVTAIAAAVSPAIWRDIQLGAIRS